MEDSGICIRRGSDRGTSGFLATVLATFGLVWLRVGTSLVPHVSAVSCWLILLGPRLGRLSSWPITILGDILGMLSRTGTGA